MKAQIICVDLDGTLIHNDMTTLALRWYCRFFPLCMFKIFFLWVIKGKALLKAQIARSLLHRLAPEELKYRTPLLNWLKEEKEKGAFLVLTTASYYQWAEKIADHLGIFDKVIASDDYITLKGIHKRNRLVQEFGYRRFWYCGDHWYVDRHVWIASEGAITVNVPCGLLKLIARETPIIRSFYDGK